MEHVVSRPRNYVEDSRGRIAKDMGGGVTHKFYKMDLVRVEKGDRAGNITGSYITAEIEVGPGPRQVSVKDLERLLETEEPIMAPDRNDRGRRDVVGPKMTIELGSSSRQWKRKEIEEIIATVSEDKPKRGRPKKNAGADNSGDEPSTAGATGS